MGDGAQMGVTADRALKTILGGAEQPSSEERMTAQEMAHWLLTATRLGDEHALDGAEYGEAARSLAGEMLRWAMANPERYAQCGIETEYDWTRDPDHGAHGMKDEFVIKHSLWGLMKEDGVPVTGYGFSGFQVGWAFNAAARCLEMPEQPNPAILEL